MAKASTKKTVERGIIKKAQQKKTTTKKSTSGSISSQAASEKSVKRQRRADQSDGTLPKLHSTTSTSSRPSAGTQNLANVDRVEVRMYCLGTGDCLAFKFYEGTEVIFTMLIDCGSCKGKPKDFQPYVTDLLKYLGEVDLLVVTHEHNDHVNGFAKCPEQFKDLRIKEAWMAWTENPQDPDGAASDLLHKREHLRTGLANALNKVKDKEKEIRKELTRDFYNRTALAATTAFLEGLDTLGEINLAEGGGGKSLAGMEAIKKKLADSNVPVKYLYPGETRSFKALAGVKFHILGPPLDKKYVYKMGKEGRDVYKKHFSIGEGILAANAFVQLGDEKERDLPFGKEYVLDDEALKPAKIAEEPQGLHTYLTACSKLVEKYKDPEKKWRQIEHEWLYAAGSLAIRLNSHINNTSLAIAIEFGKDGNVLLLPGDAEYGSWESWHMIEKWEGEGKNGKHLTEDLLNRTIFYKVGHHLSYNGTALEKGIHMMKHPELAAMATLDLNRISSRWTSTMPNKELLKDLVGRTKGKCFLMDEAQIRNAPSKTLDPTSLGESVYREGWEGNRLLYKQFVFAV